MQPFYPLPFSFTPMLSEFILLQAPTANNPNPTLKGEGDDISEAVPLTYFPDCTSRKITAQKITPQK